MFCRERIINHVAPNNATNIISRAINSSLIIYSPTLKDKLNRSNSYIYPCLLMSKRRCVVEDFMVLPANTKICVLLPIPLEEKSITSYMKTIINNEICYVTFGSSQNQRYYLCTGYIKSNVNYNLLENNSMFTRDVMNSFKLPHNNDNGNICKLHQVLSYDDFNNQHMFCPDKLIK